MLERKLIDIIVLVYNRDSNFYINFNYYCAIAEIEDINLIILDDSTEPSVEDYLKEKKFSFTYIKNSTNLGHDGNYLKGFQLSVSHYFLILSDYLVLKRRDIDVIKSTLNSNPEYPFLIINTLGRLKGFNEIIFDNKYFLKNYLWHLTLTGSIIFNNEFISKPITLDSYKNFPHVSLALKLFRKHGKTFYLNDHLFEKVNQKKSSYWNKNSFDVFLCDFFNVLHNNGFTEKESITVCQIHAKYTKLFSLKYLIKYKVHLDSKMQIFDKYVHFLPNRIKILVFILKYLPNNLFIIWKRRSSF